MVLLLRPCCRQAPFEHVIDHPQHAAVCVVEHRQVWAAGAIDSGEEFLDDPRGRLQEISVQPPAILAVARQINV